MIKKAAIASVCNIRFGLYAEPSPTGTAGYLQVRQFTDDGKLTNETDEFLDVDDKVKPHLLVDGDVLFVGKGNRLFSWRYHNTGTSVASSIFFVLQPDKNILSPDYLVALLNAPQSKAAFQQLGSGTNIYSIRKSELGAFEIPLPPMYQQMRIAALAKLHQQEIELSQKLLSQKQKLYSAIISKIIK